MGGSRDSTHPYFFIHVMKTGGTTFRWHVNRNFAAEERYPEGSIDQDLAMAKLSVPILLSQPAERLDRIRIFTGHLPYSAVELLDRPLRVMTILRDPIERAISHLKQEQAAGPLGRSLDAVYDDPEVHLPLIRDHQIRMFALAPTDAIEAFYSLPLEIDEARFARACENLEQIELVGFQHHYGDFEAELVRRYGWDLAGTGPLRTSDPVEVSDALKARLVADNQADIAFWEHARARYDRG